mgnify:CR=1 FL=1
MMNYDSGDATAEELYQPPLNCVNDIDGSYYYDSHLLSNNSNPFPSLSRENCKKLRYIVMNRYISGDILQESTEYPYPSVWALIVEVANLGNGMSCDRNVGEITSHLSTKSSKSTNSDGFAFSSPSTPRVVSSPRFRVSPSSRRYGAAPIESRYSLHSELSSYPSRDQFSFPKVDKRIFHSYQTQPSAESSSLSFFEHSGSPSSRFQTVENDYRFSAHSRVFAASPPDEREFLSPASSRPAPLSSPSYAPISLHYTSSSMDPFLDRTPIGKHSAERFEALKPLSAEEKSNV